MKNKKVLLVITVCLLLGCSSNSNNSNSKTSILPSREIDYRFTVDDLGDDVDFHTELQRNYIDDEDYENLPSQANAVTENSIPNAITLSWDCDIGSDDYVVTIGEKDDFTDAKEYEVSGKKELSLYNLKIGTRYYWTVKEKDSDIMSPTGTFSTYEKGPRNLNIPGMTNCRDIGGYETSNGGKVRQDLIFRTGNSDKITDAGKKVLNDFGMKTEIDLRDSGYKTSSPVGSHINYLVYKMAYDDYSNYLERNCESAKSTMKVFANEDNYPIFYHCRIGTDRTGFMTYLLLGLLGVDKEDIYRDYLFSNFGVIENARSLHGSDVNNVQLYYEAIDAFPGETLQEHVYNFLISIGMTAEELDEIIRINVEGGEKIEVLEDQKPLVVDADHLGHSSGFSSKSYKHSYAQTTVKYFELNKNSGSYIEASIETDADVNVAIYCYMYAATASLDIRARDAFELNIDGENVVVTAKTFSELHCRNTEGIYVAGRIAETLLYEGQHILKLTNIAGGTNSNALGANVAAIIIIPLEEAYISLD